MHFDRPKNRKQCPCGTGKTYPDCCGNFISGRKIPSTPAELMRSRYTAYTLADVDYIAKTMKSPASDHFNADDAQQWAKTVSWAGLDVIQTSQNGSKGTVEFRAYYFVHGKKHVMHEVSAFSYENGKWYYTQGILKTGAT